MKDCSASILVTEKNSQVSQLPKYNFTKIQSFVDKILALIYTKATQQCKNHTALWHKINL